MPLSDRVLLVSGDLSPTAMKWATLRCHDVQRVQRAPMASRAKYGMLWKLLGESRHGSWHGRVASRDSPHTLNKNFKSVMTVVGEAIQTKVLRSNSLAPLLLRCVRC